MGILKKGESWHRGGALKGIAESKWLPAARARTRAGLTVANATGCGCSATVAPVLARELPVRGGDKGNFLEAPTHGSLG